MSTPIFTLLIWLGSVAAGFIGALTGLGGGVVIVPLLALGFGVDIRYAIGASLISVIATSSGAASAYVKEGFSNIRIGMFLEIATTLGALAGAFLAQRIPTSTIAIVFGGILIYSAIVSIRPPRPSASVTHPDKIATYLRMNSSYPGPEGRKQYYVHSVPGGFAMMFGAGAVSGLLGIGAGVVKVIAMDKLMRVPFKVSTTTSNFMIGVTAAASAGVYLNRGYIDPGLAMPVMLGVLVGAFLGSIELMKARTPVLRKIFGLIILILAFEMIYNGITGRL
ncbi:MAG: sulfite exporter TauE/SafE family protein [Nitrospiraceae bacterium]|nr:sulfite exporter TauE/SafE family protein [Nitrospiraceae bacterium]